MPEIGLTGLPLDSPHSGTAVYTRNVVPLLPVVAPDLRFRLFTHDLTWSPPRIRSQRLRTPFSGLATRGLTWARISKFTWESVSLPVASAVCEQSLLHSLYFAAPLIVRCPLIVTVHDVIPLVLAGYHRGRASAAYSAWMSKTVARAAAIITVSQHSRTDIVRVLGVLPSRVHVIYEAADDRFTPHDAPESARTWDRYGIRSPFLLYLGGAERRKNIETLVRAWAKIANRMRKLNVMLVIVANFPSPDALYPDIPRLVRELGLERDTCLLPEVRESDKPALYRRALAFCFPSTYEGFGLTPLEAMASGTPVLASNATSIPEVVGPAGILLPPDDVNAWADAMLLIADSNALRKSLRDLGLARAARFSWTKTAQETVEVYRRVLTE